MSNYDDYDPSVHRSRVERKKQEESLNAEKAALIEQERIERQQARQQAKDEAKQEAKAANAEKSKNVLKKAAASVASSVKAAGTTAKTVTSSAKKAVSNTANKVKSNSAKGSLFASNKPVGTSNKRKPKTKKSIILTIIKIVVCFGLICCIGVGAYVGIVITKAPKIDTSDLNSLLQQSSVLYDDQGNIMDTAFSDENRTSVEIGEVPMYVRYAFIDLEDKTFERHHGFNIIRIFGAIKDAIFNGGHISGTSTITQQLARNLFLTDTMSVRSLDRKVTEAYYAVILENHLSKDEILEAYLNTINFGLGYGIQTAAQSYFSKDISEVTIAEAAALACLPQAPTKYALVQRIDLEYVTEGMENLIKTDNQYGYIWNDTGRDRINLCLGLMKQFGHISEEEYNQAIQVEIKDMVNPNFSTLESNSNYFADYVISTVIKDLQEQYGYTYETAHALVYNGGLQIYTTMNSGAQTICEAEFENDKNFPTPTSYKLDKNGNMLTPTQYVTDSETGERTKLDPVVMLYNIKNYIGEDGVFKIKTSEYEKLSDGSIKLLFGNRLAFYKTTVQGSTDISIEFRSMFEESDGKLYSIPGGYLNIPQKYKTMDDKYDVTISADFFTDYPDFFTVDDKGRLCTTNYSLRAKVIQPQAAMTIIDNATGAIKAMVGGRKTSGRMLYNRATTTHQPGSSIKPLAVYSAALQKSYELTSDSDDSTNQNDDVNQKQPFNYVYTGFDNQGTNGWGDYITAASIVDDEPTLIGGRIWPKNSYNAFNGIHTLRQALQQSVNACSIKILSQVGVDYSYDMVEKYGITTLKGESDKNLSALGVGGATEGCSTLEMASAYTTFVNDGVHKSYYCYDKVTSRSGAILLEPIKSETKVLDPGVAWIMRDILQTVVSEGIAGNAKISKQNVGGKTGTTDESNDIWFDGFTANYTASLWIGNDAKISLSSMSTAAAKLWSKVMKQIPEALDGKYSAAPDNVITAVIDTKTGLLATDNSEHVRTEYFTKGTEPTVADDKLKTVSVCADTGYLATPYCMSTTQRTGVDRGYPANHECKDFDESIPYYYCPVHNPSPDQYSIDPEYGFSHDKNGNLIDTDGNVVTGHSKETAPDSPEDVSSGSYPGYSYVYPYPYTPSQGYYNQDGILIIPSEGEESID